MEIKKRKADFAERAKMRSPGRPPVLHRSERRWFWRFGTGTSRFSLRLIAASVGDFIKSPTSARNIHSDRGVLQLEWLQYAENAVAPLRRKSLAPLRRKRTGSYVPEDDTRASAAHKEVAPWNTWLNRGCLRRPLRGAGREGSPTARTPQERSQTLFATGLSRCRG